MWWHTSLISPFKRWISVSFRPARASDTLSKQDETKTVSWTGQVAQQVKALATKLNSICGTHTVELGSQLMKVVL